jgi:hypothetical protein
MQFVLPRISAMQSTVLISVPLRLRVICEKWAEEYSDALEGIPAFSIAYAENGEEVQDLIAFLDLLADSPETSFQVRREQLVHLYILAVHHAKTHPAGKVLCEWLRPLLAIKAQS